MTLQPAYAVDGGPINGVLIRRQLQSATRGASGVVESGDLTVRPLDVPADGFVIGDGAAVIVGRHTAWDGSYYALNIGDETVSPVEGTGSEGGRTDMVVLRVTAAGAVEPYIIQGVAASARTLADTPEPGLSAVPLALITYDPSTATITGDMITDLRQMLQPRAERVLRVQRGAPTVNGEYDEAGNIVEPNWERWPQHEWTDVTIPAWATQVQVLANWDMGYYTPPGGTTGSHDARGWVRVGLVGAPSGDLFTQRCAYNFNPFTAGNGYSVNIACRDTITIPEGARGSAVSLRMYAQGVSGLIGRVRLGASSTMSVDLNFLEVAAGGATL